MRLVSLLGVVVFASRLPLGARAQAVLDGIQLEDVIDVMGVGGSPGPLAEITAGGVPKTSDSTFFGTLQQTNDI